MWESGRLAFEWLQQRLARSCGAGALAAARTWPARLVVFVFDLLRLGGTGLTPHPYSERRKALESLFADRNLSAPFTLCSSTTDPPMPTRGWNGRRPAAKALFQEAVRALPPRRGRGTSTRPASPRTPSSARSPAPPPYPSSALLRAPWRECCCGQPTGIRGRGARSRAGGAAATEANHVKFIQAHQGRIRAVRRHSVHRTAGPSAAGGVGGRRLRVCGDQAARAGHRRGRDRSRIPGAGLRDRRRQGVVGLVPSPARSRALHPGRLPDRRGEVTVGRGPSRRGERGRCPDRHHAGRHAHRAGAGRLPCPGSPTRSPST
ncbi:hypothetical protein ACGFY8_34565 [Streptomyces sp. NPDC048232]|uniref:hypothetical protein n=1 Tax=Streptomyces sp. NPDC048232 TaxID=3365520 RepID=UPI003711308F